MTETITTDIQY